MNRRWAILALIFFGIVISYVDRGNLSIAVPSMLREFGFSPATMGLLLSGFFWTYAAFQIPAGAIVDRVGIKRVYAGAFLLWSMASAAIALSRGASDILIMRMLLGFAEAAGPIASLAFIRRNFSGPEQGLPTAIYIAGQNAGPGIGFFVGTVLLARFGWRPMFAITGLGALIWLPFWLWLVPADRGKSEDSQKRVAKHEFPWRALLRQRSFWAMSICIFFSSYFWYFVLTWVPAYLTLSRGFSTLRMGGILAIPLVTMALVNILAGFIADRLVARVGSVFRVRILFAVCGYAAAGAILLLPLLPNSASVLPILVFCMCGAGIGNSNYWAISQHVPPQYMVGRTIGYLNTVAQIAGAMAPLVTGWTLGPQKQFGVAIAVAGTFSVLAAACLLAAGSRGLDRVKGLLSEASLAARGESRSASTI